MSKLYVNNLPFLFGKTIHDTVYPSSIFIVTPYVKIIETCWMYSIQTLGNYKKEVLYVQEVVTHFI